VENAPEIMASPLAEQDQRSTSNSDATPTSHMEVAARTNAAVARFIESAAGVDEDRRQARP
jgi:hypothetical protein